MTKRDIATMWGRIERRLRYTPNTECWEWLGATGKGYGKIWAPRSSGLRKCLATHRVAYEACNRRRVRAHYHRQKTAHHTGDFQ